GPSKNKFITRIWDRTVKKETGIIDEAIAIGPGPTKTTMVLIKGSPRKGWLVLHDADTDKSWPLGDKSMKVIAAQGKYIIYAKKTPDGKGGAYMAEIVLPGKAKDAKDKKTTSQPAKAKPPKIKKP
ncbi:MAG: hypothetical protein KAV00_18530, partial [Phycisphaerae bacterium]|nr:hypothetical protein [Phycisphaerae bacterium]